MTTPSREQQELAAFRAEKDTFMGRSPHSPLSTEQRQSFHGLSYYPYNPALRLVYPPPRDLPPDTVVMDTSTGEQRTYRRAERIRFEVNGQTAELTIFQGEGGEFFLPLRDATSGRDTYGAGRYLEPSLLPNGQVLVDFNYLYNPYCAYNDRWSCPLPPAENWLTVPVEAGEEKATTPDRLARFTAQAWRTARSRCSGRPPGRAARRYGRHQRPLTYCGHARLTH
ncbi:MAG: DUF1684 domain-containing protein [Dehalococcoidia bacterium]